MQITFLGATGTVTGSKYLVKAGSQKFLVECGLFQGIKALRERNWAPLPFNPSEIDAVILTHAHIDHSGYLPLLVKNGFRGPIYCSKATKDLCKILLLDSAYLQEEDAARANKYGYSRHVPALPLYTQADAQRALLQFHVLPYAREHSLSDDYTVMLQRSGHILGSAFVTIRDLDTTLTFSGDLGRPVDPVMNPPVRGIDTDYLVLECTYGDRLHDTNDPQEELGTIINKTLARGGTIVIPAFAVGRAQTLLYYIYNLKRSGAIPNVPIFLDSPMAINATYVLENNMSEHKLSAKLCKNVCDVASYVTSVEDSKAVAALATSKIIVSASGMASGGRVLHHLKAVISDPKNTILFTGYQAPETRGERILNGAPTVRIHGEDFLIKAEIVKMDNLSAHADADEIIGWLKTFAEQPRKVFLTHGEPPAALALQQRIIKELHWDCVVPDYGFKADL